LYSYVRSDIIFPMSTPPNYRTPPVPARTSSAPGTVLGDVLSGLETVRLADRTMASDEERLGWIQQVVEAERRASALKAVLIGEADEAGSAMRARHTPLRDWLAGSGQESPRRAAAAVWKARELEQRPRVRDAATSGRISLEQASAINEALNGLPTGLDKAQHRDAEDLILVAAKHMPPEKLRTMAESLVTQVAPSQAETPEQRSGRLEARDARAGARRCLRFGPETDGSIDFSGSIPVLDGRRLQQLVQAIADRSYRGAARLDPAGRRSRKASVGVEGSADRRGRRGRVRDASPAYAVAGLARRVRAGEPPTGGCSGVEGAGAGAVAEGAGRGDERPDQSGAGRGDQ